MIVHEGKEILISKELKEFILPLNNEEFSQLEKNLLKDGCREPLIVWKKNDGQLVLVDGHNRYAICQIHGINFRIKKVGFPSLEDVKIWMINNQMGRRNLTPDQLSYYRGLKYLTLKKEKGGYENVKSKGKAELATAEVLADKFNVSESTVKRDAKFAEGLNIIGKSNPKLKAKILSGEVDVKKADIQTLANAKHSDKMVIKNEADLHNKAKIIREDLLSEVETRVRRIESEKIEKAQKILRDLEPAFLPKGDRVRKIKGMIISAINRAINEKDAQAIKELKKLVEKLADELLA